MRHEGGENAPSIAASGGISANSMNALQQHRFRWVMLAGIWLIYCSFGLTVSAMAPLVGTITTELNISLSSMGAILGAWPLVYIGAAIPAGALLDRFGLRRSLFAAALIMALSGVARALSVDGLSLFLAVAVFGLGGPLVSSGAPKMIRQWFAESQRGLAMGIYITGPSLGGIAALALTNSVMMPLTGHSWRLVLLIYAALTAAAGVIWLILTTHPLAKASEASMNTPQTGLNWRAYPALLRLPVVQLVMLFCVGTFMFNHGLNNWLPQILRGHGLTAVEAGYWAAVPTAVGILGSLLIPRYAGGVRSVPVLRLLFIFAAGAAVGLIALSGMALLLPLMTQGIARSSMMTVTMLVMMQCKAVDDRNMGAAGGLFFTAGEVGGVLGPFLFGVIADITGGFELALGGLTGLCLLMLALSLALARALREQ